MSSLRDKFEERYMPVPWSGCWIWTGEVQQQGYGRLRLNDGSRILAHRLSWELHNCKPPEDRFVCHKCDVTSCVNPDHLFLGSNADNMRDMYRKNRRIRGGNFKLSAEQIAYIRSSPEISGAELARRFNVSRTTICDIRKNRSWITKEFVQ